jgi:pimeloyl-ACP methyl ester carboxylesterase
MIHLKRVVKKKLVRGLSVCAIVATGIVLPICQAEESQCDKLVELSLPHMRVLSAVRIAPGDAPSSFPNAEASFPKVDPASLPAFCRVIAQSNPVQGSSIGFEVWLPEQSWTGRLIGVGNGALAGTIFHWGMANIITQGAATFSTDTGHLDAREANGAISVAWARNQEALIDFGYRGIHEAAEGAKAITVAFYGRPVSHSYFAGCSTGGREAAAAAEHYPDDFDGILMGAPALDWSSQHEGQIFEAQQTLLNPDHFIPKDKLAMVTAAVVKKCDALDGSKDGLIADPRKCTFDPASLQCRRSDTASCLTAGQVDALKKLYAGPLNSKGEKIFYGAVPGSEAEIWANIGKMEDTNLNVVDFQLVNNDPNFNWRTMDFATQARKSRAAVGSIIDATDTDLRAFLLHGKLLSYQGWNDPYMKPERTIAFYEGVKDLVGTEMADKTYRLFMVPNMGHCEGVEFGGAFQTSESAKDPEHNALLALEAWVESDRAPDKIIATRHQTSDGSGHAVMTQPLCPYPTVAKWNGQGDIHDEKNYACGAYPPDASR